MWPDQRVVDFITHSFIPARVHVRDDAEAFQRFGERYGAQWTPTILVLDPEGTERHRVEGYVDANELLAQLALGLGLIAFQRNDMAAAARAFGEVVEQHPETDAAPQAMYWAGVARYKSGHDASALAETYRSLNSRYPDSPWTKKGSVWKK